MKYLSKLLEIKKTACVFEWENAIISVNKYSPNFMNFVELRILHLIELFRNFAIRSLKRNSEMHASSSLNTIRLVCSHSS